MDRSISHEYMPLRFPAIKQYPPRSFVHGRAEHANLPPSPRPMASRKAPKRSHADRTESPEAYRNKVSGIIGRDMICQLDDIDCKPTAINISAHAIVEALTLLQIGAKGYLSKCDQNDFFEFYKKINNITVEVAALGVEDPGKRHGISLITQKVIVRYEEVLSNSPVAMEYASCQSNQVLSSNQSNLSQSATFEIAPPPFRSQPRNPTNNLDVAIVQGCKIPDDGSCFIFTTKETWKLPHNATLKEYIKSFRAKNPTVKGAELTRKFYDHCKQDGKRLYCVQRNKDTGKRPTATRKNWHLEMYEPLKQNEAYDVLKHPMNTALDQLCRDEKELPSVCQQNSEKCTGVESHQKPKPKRSSIQSQIDFFNHSNHSKSSPPVDNHSNHSLTSQLQRESLHSFSMDMDMDILGEVDLSGLELTGGGDISEGALSFFDGTNTLKDDVGEMAGPDNDTINYNSSSWCEKIQVPAIISKNTSISQARALQAFSVLSAKTFSRCPSLALVVPAERTITRQRTGRQKFLIYFICQHSLKIIQKPLEVYVSRRWLVEVAPFLKMSLIILRFAAYTFGLPLPLSDKDISEVSQIIDLLCKEKKVDWTRFMKLVSGGLDDATIAEYQALVYPSYEIFAKTATDPKYVDDWQANITTVSDSNGTLLWVETQYAHLYLSLANTRSGDGTSHNEKDQVPWDAGSKPQRSNFEAMQKMIQHQATRNFPVPITLKSSAVDVMRDGFGKLLQNDGEGGSNAEEYARELFGGDSKI